MSMQKIVTLDGIGVCVDPRDDLKKTNKKNFNSAGRLTIKVIQTFEIVTKNNKIIKKKLLKLSGDHVEPIYPF